MSNIQIDHNSSAVIDVLQQIADNLDDLSPAMQEVAATLEDAAEQAFKHERAPTGEPWEKLSDNYLKQNPKRAEGQILQMSAGGLAVSIESDYGNGWASIGSNKPYAAIHQYGSQDIQTVREHHRLVNQAFGSPLKFGVYATVNQHKRKANMPARPYLGLDEQSQTDLLDILGEFLLN